VTDELEAFRALVFRGIKRALEIDSHCKAYEGAIMVMLPSYFANQGSGILYEPVHAYELHLACYVLGPSRSYKWKAATLSEAIRAATVDVERWIAELEEQTTEETDSCAP
jgi:hypothetical protein